jgi:hypothetical protein
VSHIDGTIKKNLRQLNPAGQMIRHEIVAPYCISVYREAQECFSS